MSHLFIDMERRLGEQARQQAQEAVDRFSRNFDRALDALNAELTDADRGRWAGVCKVMDLQRPLLDLYELLNQRAFEIRSNVLRARFIDALAGDVKVECPPRAWWRFWA